MSSIVWRTGRRYCSSRSRGARALRPRSGHSGASRSAAYGSARSGPGGDFLQYAGLRGASEARREVAGLPNDRFEELLELRRSLNRLKLQVNHDVGGIVDWLVDAFDQHTGFATRAGEPAERLEPRLEV